MTTILDQWLVNNVKYKRWSAMQADTANKLLLCSYLDLAHTAPEFVI